MSAMLSAFEMMEGMRKGWFKETLELVTGNGGVVFSDERLFFAGMPKVGDDGCLIVLMVVGDLGRLRELGEILKRDFKRACWQRCVRGDERWRVIDIEKFLTFKRFK